MKHLVLVHGAWHGAWCWEPTLRALSQSGIAAHTIELPFDGLETDARTLSALLDDIDGPKVVVGHSYGGMVISDAVDGRTDVDHLVYLCALMLEKGENVNEMILEDAEAAKTFGAIDVDDATGLATLKLEVARRLFYADCPLADTEWALAQLRPFPIASLGSVLGEPWRSIDSTYVQCATDNAVPMELQRRMSRLAGTRIEWPTGHSPFISRPDLLVELLAPLLVA